MVGDVSIEVKKLLPSSIEDLGEKIRQHMAEQGAPGGRVAWSAAGGAALTLIREKLSFDVAGCFASVWAAVAELRDYGNEAKHPRGHDEPYVLGANEVELEAEPLLIARLGSFEAPPMRFGYTLTAKFEAVTLTIRDGAVQAAALGGCRITGVLTLNGRELHKPCELAEGQVPGRLEFDPPAPIP